MPLIGWICVHTILEYFKAVEKFIPIIAFILLAYIGGKMLIEGLRHKDEVVCSFVRLKFSQIIIQGIATSIDALSVGFKIAHYSLAEALVSALVIALVTFAICFFGVIIGKKTGTLLSGKANILGGLILLFIGIQMLIDSFI
jgi:putative Mn2+ efflux pump MntP